MSTSTGNTSKIVSAKVVTAACPRYRIVLTDTGGTTAIEHVVALATASTSPLFGITMESTVSANEIAPIALEGEAWLTVDGSGTGITEGVYLMSDSTGRGIVGTTGLECIGMALAPSSAANDVIRVLISRRLLP